MKVARNIILALSAAFMIIGIHQTITLGFEVSYWIFMLSISMFFLYKLMGNVDKPGKEKKKSRSKERSQKKSKKKDKITMNRQAKRHMERLK